jgi:hypothetical protein
MMVYCSAYFRSLKSFSVCSEGLDEFTLKITVFYEGGEASGDFVLTLFIFSKFFYRLSSSNISLAFSRLCEVLSIESLDILGVYNL